MEKLFGKFIEYEPSIDIRDETIGKEFRSVIRPLLEKYNIKTVIEIGSLEGWSALCMIYEAEKLGKPIEKMYCIDTFEGSPEHQHEPLKKYLRFVNGKPTMYYQFLSNIKHHGYDHIIEPIVGKSQEVFDDIKARGITADFIYIDGLHDQASVTLDIENYYTLLNAGGVVFGDDYGWSGVAKAYDIFVQSNDIIPNTPLNLFWVIE